MKYFNEMTNEEMMEVDGGIADIIIITGLILLVGAAEVGLAAAGTAIAKDLENCYNNGYNEVMSANGGKRR